MKAILKYLPPLLVLLLMAFHSNPSSVKSKKPAPRSAAVNMSDSSLTGNFSSQSSLRFDSLQLDSFFTAYPSLQPYSSDVRRFYRTRNDAFAWYDTRGLIEQAGFLHNRIRSLSGEGINSKYPYSSLLDTLMTNAGTEDGPERLQTELFLTTMYFYFAEKAWSGLDESVTRKMEWYLPRKKSDYSQWLDSWLQSKDSNTLTKEPVYRQYPLLRTWLQKYMALTGQDWPELTLKKELTLKNRSGDTALIPIKRRLTQLGDLPAQDTTPLFDTSLVIAIKRFQYRFGLKQDGVINKLFLSELNVSPQKRIEQIRVNMERSRWIPDSVSGDYLVINIPEFKLHLYRGDSLLWDMNVVVGQSLHKTVIFSGVLKNIVFSPYWNVPPGILKKEVLPGIKKDHAYLSKHHMEWNGNTVRQKPGPWNSLGSVKFLFPNSYDIYLHDTPGKDLFQENARAFSHGCIRLAEPLKLATWLLKDNPAWDQQKIAAAAKAGKERWVTPDSSFRVFITYFTSWVDRQGRLNFRKDIYARDQRLAKTL